MLRSYKSDVYINNYLNFLRELYIYIVTGFRPFVIKLNTDNFIPQKSLV